MAKYGQVYVHKNQMNKHIQGAGMAQYVLKAENCHTLNKIGILFSFDYPLNTYKCQVKIMYVHGLCLIMMLCKI